MKRKIGLISLLFTLVLATTALTSCVIIVQDTEYTVYKTFCSAADFKSGTGIILNEGDFYADSTYSKNLFFSSKRIDGNRQRMTKDEISSFLSEKGVQPAKISAIADGFENNSTYYFGFRKNDIVYLLIK